MFLQTHYVGKWEGGGGLEMEFFWALRNGIEPIGECHLGPKVSCIKGRSGT
jgi:hypothetical protein